MSPCLSLPLGIHYQDTSFPHSRCIWSYTHWSWQWSPQLTLSPRIMSWFIYSGYLYTPRYRSMKSKISSRGDAGRVVLPSIYLLTGNTKENKALILSTNKVFLQTEDVNVLWKFSHLMICPFLYPSPCGLSRRKLILKRVGYLPATL